MSSVSKRRENESRIQPPTLYHFPTYPVDSGQDHAGQVIAKIGAEMRLGGAVGKVFATNPMQSMEL
jgi:hypothetical protein